MRSSSSRLLVTLLVLVLGGGVAAPVAAAPEGTMTWAVHITLASRWLDPAETEGIITPFMVLYALHDALVKPMPGGINTPSLAESWTQSKDGLTYEFVLRKGVKFHNGEPVTAAGREVLLRALQGRGRRSSSRSACARCRSSIPGRVRFVLKEPWPDFMTFYGTSATGAGWIVPKAYVEKVGDDGFKRAPIGAGPYKFVSFNPGVELVMEAYEGYWRKVPNLKRLVLRSMPEETTRAAALKKGEVDIAYLLTGPVAEDVQRTPGFKLVAPRESQGTFWLDLPDQWDPKSPWHDRRVRQAASPPSTEGAQPGRDAGLLVADGLADPARAGVLALLRAGRLRSGEGQAAPRRGRLSQRLRRRRLLSVAALLLDGRGPRRLSADRRHPHQDAHDGARGHVDGVAREEAQERHRGHHRRRRQRGHAARAYVSKNGVYTSGVSPRSRISSSARRARRDRKKREALSTRSSRSSTTG